MRRSAALCAVFALALLLGAGPALARGGDESMRAARLAMAQTGTCLVSRYSKRLHELMDQPWGGPGTVHRDLNKLVSSSNCLDKANAELRFSLPLARAIIFEAFYRAEFRNVAPGPGFAELPQVAYPFMPLDYRGSLAAGYLAAMTLGDCVVRLAPAEARALLLARIETAAEDAAIAALFPGIRECTPAGQKVELSKSMLRGAVAEPLYRLTRAHEGK